MASVIPKQDIEFIFGAVNQARGRRRLRVGEIIEAINTRQVKEDEYRKRPGFDRVVPTPESGSFTASAESLVADGKRLLARDAAGVVWARNGSAWQSRGTVKRMLPTLFPAKLVPSASKPVIVAVGSNFWVFTVASGAYRWTIFDASGNVVRTQTTQTAASITNLAAVSDGTYVWVLWITGASTTVTSHRFTIASPGTAVTSATYRSTTSNTAGVDMAVLDNGNIAVATLEDNGATTIALNVSYLDTATGQAKGSPAAVTTSVGGGVGGTGRAGTPSILTYGGANGSWYVTAWTTRNGLTGTGGGTSLVLATITSSNLATSARDIADTTDGVNGVIGWACGYVAANGDRVVYAATDTYAGTPTQPRPYVLTRYTWDGASVTTLVLRRYSYPVSKPQTIGGAWYLLTGFDDGPATNFLKSYFLVDSDGNIITEIAYGQGATAGLKADTAVPTMAKGMTFVTPLLVSGNKLFAATLLNTGSGGGAASVNDFAEALLSCDTAATYAAPVRLRDGIAIWPGGVPMRAGTQDDQREVAPLLSPVNATFTVSGAALAGPSVIQYLYRVVDADGTITRSAPSPAQSQTFGVGAGNAVIVKPLTHLMPGATCQIELYLSDVNDVEPRLFSVTDNDTSVTTITIAITPSSVPAGTETIYTYGGGIENVPLPASRAVSVWRNRMHVASGSELWSSLEREDGVGPRFNEAFVTQWDDGEGDIIAIAPVDWNYFAIFKRNAIAVVTGSGPTPTPGGGVSGNYETQTLRVRKGLINARSILTGPGGVYFQSLADKRIYCATTSLEVQDVSQGMEDYTTETVVATNYVEKDRQLHFFMDSGAILVLDYAHPTPEQPAGRWSRWTTSGLLVAAGATIDTDGTPVHIEAAGALRTPGTGWQDATSSASVDVLMAVTTGDLAAAGAILGEFRLDAVRTLGEWLATHTLKATITSDYGAVVTTHTSAAITAAPEEMFIRPGGHNRAQAVKVKLEELSSSGQGFVFTGLVLTVQPKAAARSASAARRVA